MSGSEKAPAVPALEMRLSVPAEGGLRELAKELAEKIGEHVGVRDGSTVAASLDRAAAQVLQPGCTEITFEFRQASHDLIIKAQCDGRASEVRCPLKS